MGTASMNSAYSMCSSIFSGLGGPDRTIYNPLSVNSAFKRSDDGRIVSMETNLNEKELENTRSSNTLTLAPSFVYKKTRAHVFYRRNLSIRNARLEINQLLRNLDRL